MELLPGTPAAFVELEVSLYVFVPVRILTEGVGDWSGFLIKNVPLRSPKLSETNFVSFTNAIAPLVCPTNCIPCSIYPKNLPCATLFNEEVSTFKISDVEL